MQNKPINEKKGKEMFADVDMKTTVIAIAALFSPVSLLSLRRLTVWNFPENVCIMFYTIMDILLRFFHSFHYVFQFHKVKQSCWKAQCCGNCLKNGKNLNIKYHYEKVHLPAKISALLHHAEIFSGCLTY